MKVMGVDACRRKWLAVVLEDGRFVETRFGQSVAGLLAACSGAKAAGVDTPIGLPDSPWREADRAARAFVGDRRQSVFPTYPRFVLEAPSYDHAKRLCVERGWPMPSVQSFGMRHRILEVDRAAAVDERIFEVHPEVSLRELVGRPLAPKRTATGAAARRLALWNAGIRLPELPYPLEDVLDSAVAAWTATRYARGEAQALPAGHSARIGAIWY